MNNDVTVNVKRVKDILDLKLCIPNYQRPYLWTEKNVQQLLEDIMFSYENKIIEYQIGTVILHSDNNSLLNIVDGQQRITTIILLYYFLQGSLPINRWDLKYRHKESFYNIKTNSKVIKEFFDNLDKKDKCKDNILKYLLESCTILVVILKEVKTAFQLFDSQNSRGKTLKPHDLLKAFHMRSMRNATMESKIKVDLKWQESNNLEDVLGIHLYRIRQWTKNKSLVNSLTKENINEFKGYNVGKIIYPYHYILEHLSNSPNISENTLARIPDMDLNPYISINQKILNGQYFFEFVDTYSRLYNKIFEDNRESLICDSLNQLKGFYNEYSKKDKYHSRVGDNYVRKLYESSLFAVCDKFGISIASDFCKILYKATYKLRIEKKRIEETTVLYSQFAKDFFSVLEHSYSHKEVKKWIEEFNRKGYDKNPPKLSDKMNEFFGEI